MAETKIPRSIYFIGAGALAAAAIFIVTQGAPVPHRSLSAMTTPTMSPLETMIRFDKPLPAERWDAS
jgi:hypothetical protein